MKGQHVTTLVVLAASALVVTAVLTAQSQDRFTLKRQTGSRSRNSEATTRGTDCYEPAG